MTSNGERGRSVIAPCAAAGLHRINFSVFGTTPAELAQVQHPRYRSTTLAARKIAALHRSIALCEEHGVRASANIVVPEAAHAVRIHRLLDEFSPHLSVRLLNSLDHGAASVEAIRAILHARGAVAVAHHVNAGTSGARTAYRLPDGRIVHFKQIRAVRMPDTCSGCRFDNGTDCQEGFYGVRLYYDTEGQFQVGVCIQRMDLCLPLHEFLSGPLPDEIRRLRRTEVRRSTSRHLHGAARRP